MHSVGGDYWDVILKKFNHIKLEEKTHLGDFVLEHFERDTISVKNNYCENVYLRFSFSQN